MRHRSPEEWWVSPPSESTPDSAELPNPVRRQGASGKIIFPSLFLLSGLGLGAFLLAYSEVHANDAHLAAEHPTELIGAAMSQPGSPLNPGSAASPAVTSAPVAAGPAGAGPGQVSANLADAGTRSGPPHLAQLALERELARQAHVLEEGATDGGSASVANPTLPAAPPAPALSTASVVLAAPPALETASDAAVRDAAVRSGQHPAARPPRATSHPSWHRGGSGLVSAAAARRPAVVVHVEPNPVMPPGGGDSNPYADSAAAEEPSPKEDAVAHRAATGVRVEPNPVMNPYERSSEPER